MESPEKEGRNPFGRNANDKKKKKKVQENLLLVGDEENIYWP